MTFGQRLSGKLWDREKCFLVEEWEANKHGYKIIGNCLKMINIVTGCGFARGHKRKKKDIDEKTHLDKPAVEFELVFN